MLSTPVLHQNMTDAQWAFGSWLKQFPFYLFFCLSVFWFLYVEKDSWDDDSFTSHGATEKGIVTFLIGLIAQVLEEQSDPEKYIPLIP